MTLDATCPHCGAVLTLRLDGSYGYEEVWTVQCPACEQDTTFEIEWTPHVVGPVKPSTVIAAGTGTCDECGGPTYLDGDSERCPRCDDGQ